jgi:FixJ family two-component response regulator
MKPHKIKIAVVEDDVSLARSFERLLRASGFDVRLHASAEDFLIAEPPPPDCLVLDIHLGGMSGLELQRQLHVAGNSIPVIFVTANDTPAGRKEAERSGCAAYLLKPVNAEVLTKAINQAVGSRSPA